MSRCQNDVKQSAPSSPFPNSSFLRRRTRFCGKAFELERKNLQGNVVVDLGKVLAGAWRSIRSTLVASAAVVGGVLKSGLVIVGPNRVSVGEDELFAVAHALEVDRTAKTSSNNLVGGRHTGNGCHSTLEGITEDLPL